MDANGKTVGMGGESDMIILEYKKLRRLIKEKVIMDQVLQLSDQQASAIFLCIKQSEIEWQSFDTLEWEEGKAFLVIDSDAKVSTAECIAEGNEGQDRIIMVNGEGYEDLQQLKADFKNWMEKVI